MTASTIGSSGINFTGLSSGMDTNSLVNAMLGSYQQKILSLTTNKSKLELEQTAFLGIESRLQDLTSLASSLGSSATNVFKTKLASSSNEDILTAAASSSASPGNYTVRVNSLAKTQIVASQGFSSTTAQIKTGTLDIKVGTGSTKTVTIDGSNNTLQGLVDTINNSGADVTASIISDGSASNTNPYRLLITAKNSGAANTIALTNNLTGGAGEQPRFDVNYVGPAVTGTTWSGTSSPTANAGPGGYTGTSNNTYSFTIKSVNGVTTAGTTGTVDTDVILVDYTDSTGTHTGTIALDPGDGADAGVFKNADEGIQAQFAAGTLKVGETFSIDAFVPNAQAASDATITIGSGAGAMNINSADNTVDDVITGLTLNLLSADSTKDVNISVTNDLENVKQTIEDFVSSYNELVDYISERQTYDEETERSGILMGNNDATEIRDVVRRVLTNVVAGVNGSMNRLSAAGITLDDEGHLSLDSSKLDSALNGQISGVTYDDVRRLFALDGVSNNSGIRFLLGTDKTKALTTPYQVDIVAAAEKAAMTATNALAASTVITTGVNDTFVINVDGRESSTITLTAGTYTRAALAQEVQNQINGNSQLSGSSVAVTVDGSNKLVITSNIYGSASKAAIKSGGTALADLGFVGTETDNGLDVVGQYLIDTDNNGSYETTEAGTGTGQVLRGNSGNAYSDGLQVMVTLTPSQVGAAVEGEITITRGLASELSKVMAPYQDPINGRFKIVNDTFGDQIENIDESIDYQKELMDKKRASLVKEFLAMEKAMSELQAASSFLSSQLGNVNLLSALGSGYGKK